jgi:hypothetical protein
LVTAPSLSSGSGYARVGYLYTEEKKTGRSILLDSYLIVQMTSKPLQRLPVVPFCIKNLEDEEPGHRFWYEEYSLAFALSQMFSPKQKELFKKRLEGLSLTKSEQE